MRGMSADSFMSKTIIPARSPLSAKKYAASGFVFPMIVSSTLPIDPSFTIALPLAAGTVQRSIILITSPLSPPNRDVISQPELSNVDENAVGGRIFLAHRSAAAGDGEKFLVMSLASPGSPPLAGVLNWQTPLAAHR